MIHRDRSQNKDRSGFAARLIGTIAASLSGLAVVLHAAGLVHLGFSIVVFAPATVVLILVIATWKQTHARSIFLQRLGAGLFAGFIGVIAYDAVRWVILVSGLVPFNPFRAIEVFGLLILKTDVDTGLSKSVGWLFHIWNGLSFAVMYTLALGRGKIWWAIGWSLVLEVAMLSTYPSMFRIMLDWPFLVVSLISHLAYGIGLGITARGAVKL